MNTTADGRGTMIQGRNAWHINNALVEEVHTQNGRTGHLLISYAVRGLQGLTMIETLRLNVNRNTIVTNQLWIPVCLCDIRPGMWIDTDFSPVMTRSIPPQTNAFRIVVLRRAQLPQPQPPRLPQTQPPHPPELPPTATMTDRVVNVDARNNFLFTGNPFDESQQMRFVVTDDTVIQDRDGRRIRLQSLQSGQLVEIERANFQTVSIPPQTTAFRIRVL